jgi:hypothetical protein
VGERWNFRLKGLSALLSPQDKRQPLWWLRVIEPFVYRRYQDRPVWNSGINVFAAITVI